MAQAPLPPAPGSTSGPRAHRGEQIPPSFIKIRCNRTDLRPIFGFWTLNFTIFGLFLASHGSGTQKNLKKSYFSRFLDPKPSNFIEIGPCLRCFGGRGPETCIFPRVFGGRGPETCILRGFWAMVGGGFYALATVWGPLGGGEGEGGKLKAAVRSHSLVAPRGGWRILLPPPVPPPLLVITVMISTTINFSMPKNFIEVGPMFEDFGTEI